MASNDMPRWPERFWGTPTDQFDDGRVLSIGDDVGSATGRAVDVSRLMGLLNYGSAFCPVSGPNDRAITGSGRAPFTELIGYSRNVTIAEGGGLVLGVTGTWDISLRMTSGFFSYPWAAQDGWSVPYLRMITTDVDGKELARESIAAAINFHSKDIVAGGTASWYRTNNFMRGSLQIKTAPVTVRIEVESPQTRLPWLGGPEWCRLTAQNISSQSIEGAATGGEESTENEG
jgi:hypothetical protein